MLDFTLGKNLEHFFPEVFGSTARIHNYKVIGPMSLDDSMEIIVYVKFQRTKHSPIEEKAITLKLAIGTTTIRDTKGIHYV
jgi:hypothetical protein